MIAVPARVLTAPRVMYAGNTAANPVNGSWNMKDKKVLDPASLPAWTILRIGAGAMVDDTALEQHCKALTANLRSCGLKVGAPQVFPGPSIPALNERKDENDSFLDKTFVDLKLRMVFEQCKDRKIGMLLVVLSSTTPWIRERVKFWGDKEHGNCYLFFISSSPFILILASRDSH